MNRTESVSIGRRGFVCETDAYRVLKEYLARAEKRLQADPDKAEILADLELSMAGHLAELSGELVVDKPTADRVVELMGEVEVDEDVERSDHEEAQTTSEGSFMDRLQAMFKKPLYKDHDRAIGDGICAGIAKSLDIDPVWVRVVFLVLLFATQGFMILIYILLAIIMKEPTDTKKKTASEVVDEIKEKLTNSVSVHRPYEKVLRRVVVLFLKIVWAILQTIVCVVLIATAISWASLFFMLGGSDAIELFGQKPGPLEYTLIASTGLVLLIPLYELLSAMIRPRPSRSRTTLVLWCLWALSLIVAVGSGVNVVPKTIDYLKRERPDNRFVRVQMVGGEIASLCVSPLGTCADNEQILTYERLCDRDITVYLKDDRPVWLSRGWFMQTVSLEYPAQDATYCAKLQELYGLYGSNNIMFAGQTLNDPAYVSNDQIVQNQEIPNTMVPADKPYWQMEFLTRY